MKKDWMEMLGIMLLLCLVALFCLAFNPSESLMKKSQNQNKSASPEPQPELCFVRSFTLLGLCKLSNTGPQGKLGVNFNCTSVFRYAAKSMSEKFDLYKCILLGYFSVNCLALEVSTVDICVTGS